MDQESEKSDIVANLRRFDITKTQRDDWVRRYAHILTKSGTNRPNLRPVGGRGHTGLAFEISQDTGLRKRLINSILSATARPVAEFDTSSLMRGH